MKTTNEYTAKAESFLSANGLKCRIAMSNTKPASWEPAGNHYRVTISRAGSTLHNGWDVYENGKLKDTVFDSEKDGNEVRRSLINHDGYSDGITVRKARREGARLAFDFWGSVNDANNGEDPTAYDVLACISSDAYCPESFGDFCSEYGYEEDSRKAFQTFNRADRFAKRIRAFFSESELAALSEIN